MAERSPYTHMRITNMIINASTQHPHPDEYMYQYGTAGIRTRASRLDGAGFTTGLAAAARSKKLGGQVVGVMITASHNPPEDNGMKIVEPMGEMLETNWEANVTALANAGDDDARAEAYNTIVTKQKIRHDSPAHVVYARDTRPSGQNLILALHDGLYATDAKHTDLGVLTTPQLHYIVRCMNTKGTHLEYGKPTEEGYNEKMSAAFAVAMKHKKSTGVVYVDCANGVGGPKLRKIAELIPSALEGGIDIKTVNDDTTNPGALNRECGADHVKTTQRPPLGYKPVPGSRYASFDGDADRLMCYFTDDKGRFHLLDGDRQATLAAEYLGYLLSKSGLADKLKIGVVQTAYANGASTEYITTVLKLETKCTATGVKHLHHAAERFDIGVYFEANGHGTVLFSPRTLKQLKDYKPQSPAQLDALEGLRAMSNLINQTVGDAISDLLMVEVILAHKRWGPAEWLATYTDLPNRLVRVEVKDRNLFKTTEDERRIIYPERMQRDIDQTTVKYNKGRAFARASGTEDAVRVYAEAQTPAEAGDLANRVAELVKFYSSDPLKNMSGLTIHT